MIVKSNTLLLFVAHGWVCDTRVGCSCYNDGICVLCWRVRFERIKFNTHCFMVLCLELVNYLNIMLYLHSEGPKIQTARLRFLLGDMPMKAITCLIFWRISFSLAITSSNFALVRVMMGDFLVMRV